jgi:predicted nucleic acid-binding protein
MAGSSWYTAILDANVLYPQLLRDTLLSLAVERLYHARWSATIHDEWTRNLVKDRPDMASELPAVVALMNTSVPDCLVTHYEKLADSIELPDPDDRHVVAAAIVGHADAIVTFNLETAVGCTRVCRERRAWQGGTKQRTPVRNEEQRGQDRRARCNRVHSAVT